MSEKETSKTSSYTQNKFLPALLSPRFFKISSVNIPLKCAKEKTVHQIDCTVGKTVIVKGNREQGIGNREQGTTIYGRFCK